MSDLNDWNQQNNQNESTEYHDPLATQEEQTTKKKVNQTTVIAAVVSAVLVLVVGVGGALICFAGYGAVYGILKSKLPLTARIILSIVVGVVFVALLVLFILWAASMQSTLRQ